MIIRKKLFSLLGFELFDIPLEDGFNLTEDEAEELFTISKKQDVAHIVAQAVQRAGLILGLGQRTADFEKEKQLAFFRYAKLKSEAELVSRILSQNGIDSLLLKGSVIRDHYKNPWQRISCDVDILVRENDIKRAVTVLGDGYGFTKQKDAYHDVPFISKRGVTVELHFSLKEQKEPMDTVLSRVWDYAVPMYTAPHNYKMSEEFLIFHTVAHAAYHFLSGGCGIRPMIDLHYMQKSLSYDEHVLKNLLTEGGVYEFYLAMNKLISVWFLGKEGNALTRELEDYIFSSGIYGDMEKKIKISASNAGSTTAYAAKRIFLPYERLKMNYPSLEGKKYLTPIYNVIRWFSFLSVKKIKRARAELKMAQINDKGKKVTDLVRRVGL